MRITRVEAIHLRLPKVHEVADGTQECLLVQVHTDAGLTGLGEVVSASYVARAVIEAPRSAPFRHGLDAIVRGMDPLDLDGVTAAMLGGTRWYGPGGVVRHAIGGVDMALWDIRGKATGKPVRALLSESAVDAVPAYASVLWPQTPQEVAASAHRFVEQGYRAVKYGWSPMGPDAALDEALVAAARQALGEEVALMVDGGRAWDLQSALERVERFLPYGLTWLEEPLAPDDLAGYRDLCQASPIPIAAGEVNTLPAEFAELMQQSGIPIVQPDLGRVGGISGGLEIERLGQLHGIRAVPHAYGTGVLLAASAQWAAASPQPLTEYTRSPSPLARELAQHEMLFRDGALHLSAAPGLGVELNEEVVRRYRV